MIFLSPRKQAHIPLPHGNHYKQRASLDINLSFNIERGNNP